MDAALTGDHKRGSVELVDEDGDSHMDSGDESDTTTTGAATHTSPIKSIQNAHEPSSSPRPDAFTSIGSPQVPTPEALQALRLSGKQRTSQPVKNEPGGDAYSEAAKVEGMMDTSESPLRL